MNAPLDRSTCDAIVLAGGRGSRMAGEAASAVDKPLLTVGGRRMLDIVLDAVSGCRRTVLVGPLRSDVRPGVIQISEAPPGGGPVAAIAAGLECLDDTAETSELVAILASDTPSLTGRELDILLSALGDSTAPAVFAVDASGRTQYLLGLWRVSALRSALACLDSVHGTSVRALVPAQHILVELPGIEDCDTPAELRAARLAAAATRGEPEVLGVADALARIRHELPLLPQRRTGTIDAAGSVLAGPLVAGTALPAVDISAMDGYAVCGDEPWHIRDDVAYAGTADLNALSPGTAVRIATGAQVPAGATAVVRDEHMVLGADGVLRRTAAATDQDDSRRRGEDWQVGTELVPLGSPVDSAVRSVAASAEVTELLVRGPVKARIVISGTEIRAHGRLQPGETRDVLGPVLPTFAAHCGIHAVDVTHLDDTAEGFRTVLAAAADVDLLIVIGATGRGAADQLRTALVAADARTVVGRMRIRPGGSQVTAVLPSGLVVLGLPGNPLAAISTLLLTAPAIVDAMTGRTERAPRLGVLANPEDVRSDVPRIVPVTAEGTRWRADTGVRTAHLAFLVGRDALAVVPANVSDDEPVTLLPLPR